MTYNYLYHGVCLGMLLYKYTDYSSRKKQMTGSLLTVYIMSALVVISDCAWNALSYHGSGNVFLGYSVNIIYFAAELIGVYAWMRFSLKTLGSVLYTNRLYIALLTAPAVISACLIFVSPFTGYVFSIENGEYIRGKLFAADSVIKLGYLAFSSVYAVSCSHRERFRYMKRRCMLLALYCFPVIIGGALQAAFGLDFNCIAPAFGLAIVYRYGLSNELKEYGDLFNALTRVYSSVFVINADSHTVRVIRSEGPYRNLAGRISGSTYENIVRDALHNNIAPEDRLLFEKGFDIENVLHRLETDETYSVVYKVRTGQGEWYNKATFMKAFGDGDRHEISLGIKPLQAGQIILRERETLESEREEFERVKESFTNTVASIVEARDLDSGEHVMRVKSMTQYLCNQILEDCPEYGLTPLKIRYIVNGSALHDVGKIMIPDSILMKPGKLTAEEFDIMKTHCVKGCGILDRLPPDLDVEYVRYAKEICRWHHEKYDGKGYPDGLKGEAIPISAQIVSIADCFDALTMDRVYREALPADEAYRMILDGECGAFNPKLLDCFRKVYSSYFSGK